MLRSVHRLEGSHLALSAAKSKKPLATTRRPACKHGSTARALGKKSFLCRISAETQIGANENHISTDDHASDPNDRRGIALYGPQFLALVPPIAVAVGLVLASVDAASDQGHQAYMRDVFFHQYLSVGQPEQNARQLAEIALARLAPSNSKSEPENSESRPRRGVTEV